jgi:hypothetical protein
MRIFFRYFSPKNKSPEVNSGQAVALLCMDFLAKTIEKILHLKLPV